MLNIHNRVIRVLENTIDKFSNGELLESEKLPNMHILNDLGMDSINQIEFIMAIEEEFRIDIPDDDAEKLLTIGQIEKYIADRINK